MKYALGVFWVLSALAISVFLDFQPVQALEPDSNASGAVLKARIFQDIPDLPSEMYGNWLRHRTLLESSFPQKYDPEAQGSWIIVREHDRILLQNPSNGASSEIQVQSVHGRTAKFQYRSRYYGMACIEELSLEGLGNEMRGYQEKICYPNQAEQQEYHALARVEAFRLDGEASW